jgi:hypothetical protein
MITRTGGGKFNPKEQNVYFLASNAERLLQSHDTTSHILMAVNELEGQASMDYFELAVNDPTKRVFLDSGVYNLATSYAKAHGVTMDVALSMAPDEMDGFADLFERYVHITKTYGDRLWGYIEIDQGGRENKIKTRAKLEALGLRPIPVYHPFNDGWDYFDYLAIRYDRMCFGNIVKANGPTRLRLLATAYERHRLYPHLWIHVLGLTPNQWLAAMPINSGDSSTWLAPLRWPTFPVKCDGASLSELGPEYRYDQESESESPRGHIKNTKLTAYQARLDMQCWRRHMADMNRLGFETYPPVHHNERRFLAR